jgi:AmmeMemoRadiSam system protein A
MSSTEPAAAPKSDADLSVPPLSAADRRLLLELARASIAHGLSKGFPLPVVLDTQPPALRAERAAFVTLHAQGQLRGCIGHLEAVAPLAVDVAENAYAAAFQDPRFPPLAETELDRVHVEISALTPAEPIIFTSEDDLIAALVPGLDGIILADGPRRGTFLPSVWEQLPNRHDFLRHLKQKAGLSPEHWSDRVRAWRYRCEAFGE